MKEMRFKKIQPVDNRLLLLLLLLLPLLLLIAELLNKHVPIELEDYNPWLLPNRYDVLFFLIKNRMHRRLIARFNWNVRL